MYRVINAFTDRFDNHYKYNPGDVYPRGGLEIDTSKIERLITTKNKYKRVFIVEEEEPKESEPVSAKKAKKRKKKSEVNTDVNGDLRGN